MGKKGRHKSRGHYCWACDCQLPNESFSGKGHRRHVCKECSQLGSEELAFRQELKNLYQCCDWDGSILRRRKKTFEQFLNHSDSLIRHIAQLTQLEDLEIRAERAAFATGRLAEFWSQIEDESDNDFGYDAELARQFEAELFWEDYFERNS
ncbi:MAG: hypothetical protein JWM11_4647 [Planctomycetaceae bacterium]|nr:hypothetical protein [Planctomycetaceae bacterium]